MRFLPLLQTKSYKDSRSERESQDKSTLDSTPNKEQSICHTWAPSSLHEEKLETDVLINPKGTAKIEAPTFKENKVRLTPDIWCHHTL